MTTYDLFTIWLLCLIGFQIGERIAHTRISLATFLLCVILTKILLMS